MDEILASYIFDNAASKAAFKRLLDDIYNRQMNMKVGEAFYVIPPRPVEFEDVTDTLP